MTAVAEDFGSSKKGLLTPGGLDGFTPQHTETEVRNPGECKCLYVYE